MALVWFRRVGIPLIVAVALFAFAGMYNSNVAGFLGLVALAWSGGGARDYKVYRNARIRAEASRDARAAFRT